MSTVDHVTLDEYEEPNPPNGRRPAPKANPFFRFVFPVVIIASGLAVFLLWREGTKAVLDSTDGTVLEIVTDPGQPGYEVFVDPTPTMLLVHLDDGELVGLTVFAATLLDNGGHAVLVGADVASDGIDGPTFAQRWRTGGMDAVERDLGAMFGFGFVETDAIETPELDQLLSLSEPFPINLLDPLVEVNEDGRTMVFPRAGGQQLDGDAVLGGEGLVDVLPQREVAGLALERFVRPLRQLSDLHEPLPLAGDVAHGRDVDLLVPGLRDPPRLVW